MSLTTDAAPPGRVPPAATAPWPIQPPPHGATAFEIPVHPVARRRGAIGLVGALVGAAAAAAVGLAVAVPLVLGRRAKGTHRRRGRVRA